MPLSWNDIRNNAYAFSRDWAAETREHAEAKSFWDEFFLVFGIKRRRVASFEHAVTKLNQHRGNIDLFWPGMLLVEHKSRGQDLARAQNQALDYFAGLPENQLPRYIIVSDFLHFRLEDLDEGTVTEFRLEDLPAHIQVFGFIAGYVAKPVVPQSIVNIKAAERMGVLHDKIKDSNYRGHDLELLLVRLLFCLFAEDTGIFQQGAFREWVENRTAEDGSNLGPLLVQLFEVLDTPPEQRQTTLDELLADLPYVNGQLFSQKIRTPAFNREMRDALLDACALNWHAISPAIFGALFQSIMDATARRNLGAHYTSEENITKLIGPLFLDDLKAEFARVQSNRQKLIEFRNRLATLKFFDPACGCGNFLVVAYRELRKLEIDVIVKLYGARAGTLELDSSHLSLVDVDQFYGIEIEEFPAFIAQVALWLTDHQMNMEVSRKFGPYFARIPLRKSATIRHANALTTDWATVLAPDQCSYLLGNPPFVGAKYMSAQQRQDAQAVFNGIQNGGLLDFVAAWYVKAGRYLEQARATREAAGMTDATPTMRCAFVSTNSICQGEQVGILWGWLLGRGVKIQFAHRTFSWSNEARGVAAVHCVIVGFGLGAVASKLLFDYETVDGEPHARVAANINPYLVDAPDIVLVRRSAPLGPVPAIGIGSQPIDDGNYLFTPEERVAFLQAEPGAEPYFHRILGSREFIQGIERWCLWLGDCPPQVLAGLPLCKERVAKVRAFRAKSSRDQTVQAASMPTHFGTELLPQGPYLLIPSASSENRAYVPIGFMPPEVFCTNLVFMLPEGRLQHFGLLSSTMHNAWMRAVCGRMKSDYRYSAQIVYNNFPWPDLTNPKTVQAIEVAAQGVLDARALYPYSSPAILYDPNLTPSELVAAHRQLDRAVDAAYGKRKFTSDADRVAFLFERYLEVTDELRLRESAARPPRKAGKAPAKGG